MAALNEYWKPFFDLMGAQLRRRIALILYADTYRCTEELDTNMKKPGLTAKQMSEIVKAPERTVRYHAHKLVASGLAEKYAGIEDRRAVGFYTASGRFVKTMESLGIGEGMHNSYSKTREISEKL